MYLIPSTVRCRAQSAQSLSHLFTENQYRIKWVKFFQIVDLKLCAHALIRTNAMVPKKKNKYKMNKIKKSLDTDQPYMFNCVQLIICIWIAVIFVSFYFRSCAVLTWTLSPHNIEHPSIHTLFITGVHRHCDASFVCVFGVRSIYTDGGVWPNTRIHLHIVEVYVWIWFSFNHLLYHTSPSPLRWTN